MGFLIGLLTLVMVLDCVVLVFLVLIQLPKKDAGAGLAFGGAATDALFGAGSGNVLTNITKYSAIVFFVLAVGLSILQRQYHNRTTSEFERQLAAPAAAAPASTTPASTPAPAGKSPAALASTNLLITPAAEATNAPASPASPAPTPAAPK